MAKYTIKDFQVGETVYHLSNTSIKMVTILINPEMNEITCRWVDKKGNMQVIEFMPEELGKAKDIGIRFSSI